MGKITGFIEIERQSEKYLAVDKRVKNYNEFVATLDDNIAVDQGARCMDCGIPFCHNGCPVNNVIPDWNHLVYSGKWQEALDSLHSTNNFPEITGRICPAPCEAACTLGINADAVTIKSIERAIADKAWAEGLIKPRKVLHNKKEKIAIIGSGPAGLAAAQQLNYAGYHVVVFEKNHQAGGLLQYGIPNFKLEKKIVARRVGQLVTEGVVFRTNTLVAVDNLPLSIANHSQTVVSAEEIRRQFDAVILAAGSEVPRDLPIPGRELKGVHFAMEYLVGQTVELTRDDFSNPINAHGKNVVVIGGGDTGSDCVGTANRQGAKSVTQFEVMPRPPEQEDKPLVWPYWPLKLRTSSSHDEGCTRQFAVNTKEFIGKAGKLQALQTVELQWQNGKMCEVSGSQKEIAVDLVFLAMGFTNPHAQLLNKFAINSDTRGNAQATCEGDNAYTTNVPGIFAAGDVRRGQSLVVWAIREGRQCAVAVEKYLENKSN